MKLSDFDYYLPEELIAQSPIEPRDASRLMVLGKTIEHRHFSDILDYLEKGDTLVLNDSRVIPAKLKGKKITGGHVEALVVSKSGAGYECLIQGKNIHEGTQLYFGELEATVIEVKKDTTGARYIVIAAIRRAFIKYHGNVRANNFLVFNTGLRRIGILFPIARILVCKSLISDLEREIPAYHLETPLSVNIALSQCMNL